MSTLPTNSPAAQPQLASPTRKPPTWLTPVLLLVAFAAQSAWFIVTQSLTYDEPAHIIAGVEGWQQGRFEHWNDHPPLGRLWLTLPIAHAAVHFTWRQLPTGFLVTAMHPGPEWFARRVRPMNTVLGLLLGISLWFAARRLFSEGAANVSLALFAFTPSLIAHYSVATTDGIGTLFIFLAAVQLVRWRRDASWKQTFLLGVVLGGLMLSKFYAPPLVLLTLGLMLVLKPGSGFRIPSQWNWKATLTAAAVMLVTLWAGYFFHLSRLTIANGEVRATYPNRAEKVWATKSNLRLHTVVPAGEFFEGLREVALSNRRGRPAWFLGQIYPRGGIRLYYPVAIALKWPPILLLLLALALFLQAAKKLGYFPALERHRYIPPEPIRGNQPRARTSAREGIPSFSQGTPQSTNPYPRTGDFALMALFAFVYLFLAIQSRYDIGERHILPLYPFALLVAGGIWQHVRTHRIASAIVVVALCLNAADCLRAAPDYLAYFTPFVAAENRWRLLTDSNLDWGQGLIAVREYERGHSGEQIRLAYFGSVDPGLYDVHSSPLAPGHVADGTLIVGASCLSGQVLDDPGSYRWLWAHPPMRVLDGSMLLYQLGYAAAPTQ